MILPALAPKNSPLPGSWSRISVSLNCSATMRYLIGNGPILRPGKYRDIRTAAKLKGMGVRRGWPDFLLIAPDGHVHCLELKRKNASLTDDQESFMLWCIAHGVPHSVAHTIDEVLTVFACWGCLRIKIP